MYMYGARTVHVRVVWWWCVKCVLAWTLLLSLSGTSPPWSDPLHLSHVGSNPEGFSWQGEQTFSGYWGNGTEYTQPREESTYMYSCTCIVLVHVHCLCVHRVWVERFTNVCLTCNTAIMTICCYRIGAEVTCLSGDYQVLLLQNRGWITCTHTWLHVNNHTCTCMY